MMPHACASSFVIRHSSFPLLPPLRRSAIVGHRVVTGRAPWIAAANAPDAQPRAAEDSVFLHGFGEVFGACGLKSAACAGAGDRMNDRGDDQLIALEEFAHEPSHGSTPARRAKAVHSSRNAATVAFAARGLATITSQVPAGKPARESRMISRSLRRIRFRITAPPTFFEVTNPMRAGFSSAPLSTPTTISFPCWASPLVRTRRNSEDSVRCAFLGKRRRGGRFKESSAASWRILSSG